MRPFPRPTTASAVIRLSDACPSDLASLDDQTLLALWLARSLPGDIVDTVAAALIERFGGIGDVASAGSAALSQMPGMGRTPILDLKLLRALCVRLSRSAACKRPVLSSWSALVAYCRITLAHLPREQFRTLYLDRRNILLRDEYVADGSVDHAPSIQGKSSGGRWNFRPRPSSWSTIIRPATRPPRRPTSQSPARSWTPPDCSACRCTITSSSGERGPQAFAPSA